jgi:hypothetical protein
VCRFIDKRRRQNAWDDKIADLFNHGLNDEEIADFFTPEQFRNFMRDYAECLRDVLAG